MSDEDQVDQTQEETLDVDKKSISNFINDQTWHIHHTVLKVSQQVRQMIENRRGESLGDRIRK